MSSLIPLVEIVLAIVLFTMAMVILTLVKTVLGFLPAIIAALVIWFVTRSLLSAAVAFVIIAFLWVLVKRK